MSVDVKEVSIIKVCNNDHDDYSVGFHFQDEWSVAVVTMSNHLDNNQVVENITNAVGREVTRLVRDQVRKKLR